MNRDIHAWNDDIRANAKVKAGVPHETQQPLAGASSHQSAIGAFPKRNGGGKWRYQDGALKLGLIDPIPEIVFKRVIHVHDAGLKRVHSRSQWHGYCWLDEHEPLRCSGLIETVPAGNLTLDEDGNKVFNLEMSAPRMPEWLNKDNEAEAEDEETGMEVSYSTLCYDGETEMAMDRYEDM
jgi:hypothetical protein